MDRDEPGTVPPPLLSILGHGRDSPGRPPAAPFPDPPSMDKHGPLGGRRRTRATSSGTATRKIPECGFGEDGEQERGQLTGMSNAGRATRVPTGGHRPAKAPGRGQGRVSRPYRARNHPMAGGLRTADNRRLPGAGTVFNADAVPLHDRRIPFRQRQRVHNPCPPPPPADLPR